MKRLLVSVAAAAALAVGALLPGAQAADPVTVSIIGCAFGGGATVPADAPITLRVRFVDRNRGLVQDVLNAQTTSVSVGGSPVAGASDLYGPIVEVDDGFWLTTWLYDTGVSLASGETLEVTLDISVSHRIPQGKDLDGHPVFAGPGSLFGGPILCTITGA